jgi:hypothetical protein
LIIRSAYDTTALVDNTYCANKVNFLNLVKNSAFGHQFAYKDSDGNLVNNITTILDNGAHPNFILKAVVPQYDKKVFPKLFRVENETQLQTVLENVNSDYFLMTFHYNGSKLYNNHIQVVRSLNLLLPPALESIQIGQYIKLCGNSVQASPNYDATTFELNNDERENYLTTVPRYSLPKLLDTDLVEMADGSFKTALELEIGDEVKTIDIPNPFDINNGEEVNNYKISFSELQSGATYSANRITNKKRVSSLTGIGTLNFTDGTSWSDTIASSYLTERAGEIQFLKLAQMEIGDKVILIDTSSETLSFVEKIVESKSVIHDFFEGWFITVEREHLFLTKASNDTSTSYVSIEHNYYGAGCNIYISMNCRWCSQACSNCGKSYSCYGSNWGGWGWCSYMC